MVLLNRLRLFVFFSFSQLATAAQEEERAELEYIVES